MAHLQRVRASGTWESIVLADESIRLDGLMTAKALARLADDNCEVRAPVRSLADAVDYKDAAGRRIATVQRGLRMLADAGYVVRLNPDAARSQRGHYRLTVPAKRLAV